MEGLGTVEALSPPLSTRVEEVTQGAQSAVTQGAEGGQDAPQTQGSSKKSVSGSGSGGSAKLQAQRAKKVSKSRRGKKEKSARATDANEVDRDQAPPTAGGEQLVELFSAQVVASLLAPPPIEPAPMPGQTGAVGSQNLGSSGSMQLSSAPQATILHVLLRVFEYAKDKPELRQYLSLQQGLELLDQVHMLTTSTIHVFYKDDAVAREKYLTLTQDIFADPCNIGNTVRALMKCADELKAVANLDGPAKKELVGQVFRGLINFSELTPQEKELAGYAFDGVVEAIIWAKKGGLAEVKKGCLKFWAC